MDNNKVPQRGILINGVGDVPKWLIDESDRLYPKGSDIDQRISAVLQQQAHIKARMMSVEDAIGFAEWLWHNTYEQRWKDENRRFYNKDGEPKTTAQLYTIYQQQKEKI